LHFTGKGSGLVALRKGNAKKFFFIRNASDSRPNLPALQNKLIYYPNIKVKKHFTNQ
jgi:hypothetical protein